MLSKETIVSTFILTLLCATIQFMVSQKVTDPFIDEIFHLRQCYTYCEYKFDVWDEKITTPPGLYILGFLYAKMVSLSSVIPLKYLCGSYTFLRSLNLVGGTIVFPKVLSHIGRSKEQFWIVNIISLPLFFTYMFLFYTDVWSLILVVSALILAHESKNHSIIYPLASGALGFFSLWFRQTNIIWIAFIAAVYIDKDIKQRNASDYLRAYISNTITNFVNLSPFVLNMILFVIFLKVNGGITFGDKENHEVQVHLVQLFYCFVFISCFTIPSWLSIQKIKRYLSFTCGRFSIIKISITFLSFILIKIIINKFTIVHPFLLADNRHYTFYLWKRILSHPYSEILMIPIYHFSTWNIYDGLKRNNGPCSLGPISILAYFIAVTLTIVPSPLFEPRYYIVPLILFRLFTTPEDNSYKRNIIEFLYLQTINALFFMVFFNYEFTWMSEPTSIQRIIW